MERQDITISPPKDILKQAKLLAVEKGTSLSGLLREYLEGLVRKDAVYRQAARRMKKRLKTGLSLGTRGTVNWTRESRQSPLWGVSQAR